MYSMNNKCTERRYQKRQWTSLQWNQYFRFSRSLLSHPPAVHSSAILSQWTSRDFLFPLLPSSHIHSQACSFTPVPSSIFSTPSSASIWPRGVHGDFFTCLYFPRLAPLHCMVTAALLHPSLARSLPPCFLISLLLSKPLGVEDRTLLLWSIATGSLPDYCLSSSICIGSHHMQPPLFPSAAPLPHTNTYPIS